ncbi:hypothetical protein [Nocardiopsis metallicus]|uniref:Uncharacterized protein n=1 Tax=Nocardiopsis metallicus TaxID=179819 RepID=A0A840WAL0_9ACTN|nr:hypothetical protein [Nocardiopsis metallicus]MBB5493184.1 hypothetical protein [Nocardiopsis metallicus]
MNLDLNPGSPRCTLLARAAAGTASLTLAVALTSCSFQIGDLQPVGEDTSAPVDSAEEPVTDADEQPEEDGAAGDEAEEAAVDGTQDELPMDPAEAVTWAGDNYWLSGSGDAFYRLDWTLADSTTLQLTHSGSSNFIIVTYGADGTRYASMVNEIGDYEGSTTMSDLPLLDGPEAVEFIHIQADGAWTIGR